MALVVSGNFGGFELNVTLVDNGGNSSTLSYALVAADYAAAAAAATTILGRIAGVTNAVVKTYSIVQRYVEDALTLPGSGVHVEDRLITTVQLTSSPLKTATFVVPAPKAGLFQGTAGEDADTLDTADPEIQAYASTWHATGLAQISDGEAVEDAPRAGIKRGKRTHRRSSFG